jgi:hypothetical protein
MITFKEYLSEDQTPLQKAEQMLMAGDKEAAKKYLAQHVPGKNRKNDALAAKLMYRLKQK